MDNTKTTIEKTIQTDIDITTSYKGKGKGSNPNSIKNLSIITSTEIARERGRKGGLKSGETKKRRKSMKENMLTLLESELPEKKLKELGVDTSALNGDFTIQNAMSLSMMIQALSGDVRAMQLVRDTIGEKPIEETHNINETITADDVSLIDNMKKSLIG